MSSAAFEPVCLDELLTQDRTYVAEPEARVYPKLSVKLYGKGVVLDRPVDGATLRMKRHQIARAGQVILSEIWGKKGALGFVPPEGDGALCTSHFFLFDVDESRVSRGWLAALFQADYLAAQLADQAFGTTGYAAVRPKHLLACSVPLPSPTEQHRIVAKVEALSAKVGEARRLRERADANAAALRRAFLRDAFDHDFPCVQLASVCTHVVDCLHSNPIFAEQGVPTVRSPDVGWGALHPEQAKRTSEAEFERRTQRGIPATGDLVLVREGGGTGKAGLVQPHHRFSLGQRVMMLRPDRAKVLPEFLLYQWLSPFVFDDQIMPRLKGSASPHLNITDLKRFDFLLPPLQEQQRMVDGIRAMMSRLDVLQKHQAGTGRQLDALLPSILDKAFRGEL